MNSSQGLVLYYLARTRDEEIARVSVTPTTMARRELEAAGHGRSRRHRRRWLR